MGGIKLEIVNRMPAYTRHARRRARSYARPRLGHTRRGTLFRRNPRTYVGRTVLPNKTQAYLNYLSNISSFGHSYTKLGRAATSKSIRRLGRATSLRGGTRKNRRSNKN
jgi:hypothetical protein